MDNQEQITKHCILMGTLQRESIFINGGAYQSKLSDSGRLSFAHSLVLDFYGTLATSWVVLATTAIDLWRCLLIQITERKFY